MTPSSEKQPRLAKPDDFEARERILSLLGIEPTAWGSRRRWQFLRSIAKHIHEVDGTSIDELFVWTTPHCQCMKMRTLREDYLDHLERIGLIRVDWNNGYIRWNKEA